jgi:putative superfamily III holin-X
VDIETDRPHDLEGNVMIAWEAGREPDPARPTGELLGDLAEELRRLARAEVQLAMTETRRKAKRMGMAAAAVGTAAVLGLGAVGALVASAVAALALVLPVWLAALLTAVGVLGLAGAMALVGRFALRHALPIIPQWTLSSVREDVETIRKGVHP